MAPAFTKLTLKLLKLFWNLFIENIWTREKCESSLKIWKLIVAYVIIYETG